MNKNLALLVSSQVFGFTAATVTVFISGIIGAKGLGQDVLEALQYANVGQGILAGVAILFVALILDRVVQGKKRV